MKLRLLPLSLLLCVGSAMADTTVPMYAVDAQGVGASIGQVRISETPYGLVFTPTLQGLAPGVHGFHLHQNPSCDAKENDGKMVAALAAGGHYDPQQSKRHDSPWGDGHLGDLPPLYVNADGSANQPVLAPRLKTADLAGRSLMVHAGGDNHADHPAPLGGGGARVACGVIQ
jgi:Cu-Zn family superoxide dismutase